MNMDATQTKNLILNKEWKSKNGELRLLVWQDLHTNILILSRETKIFWGALPLASSLSYGPGHYTWLEEVFLILAYVPLHLLKAPLWKEVV